MRTLYIQFFILLFALNGLAQTNLNLISRTATLNCTSLFVNDNFKSVSDLIALAELRDFSLRSANAPAETQPTLIYMLGQKIESLLGRGIPQHAITTALTSARNPATLSPLQQPQASEFSDESDLRRWIPTKKLPLNLVDISDGWFSPSGDFILLFSRHEITIFDRNGEIVHRYQNEEIEIYHAAFFPEETGYYLFAYNYSDNSIASEVKYFDFKTIQPLNQFRVSEAKFGMTQFYFGDYFQIALSEIGDHQPGSIFSRLFSGESLLDEDVKVQSIPGHTIRSSENLNLKRNLLGDPNFRIATYDPHLFSILLFDSDGKLDGFFSEARLEDSFEPFTPQVIMISPEQEQILVLEEKSQSLWYWKTSRERVVRKIKDDSYLLAAHFTASGFLAITQDTSEEYNDTNLIRIWDETGQEIGKFEFPNKSAVRTSAQFFADGEFILISAPPLLSTIINSQGRIIEVLKDRHSTESRESRVSSDGSRIFTIQNKDAQIWEPRSVLASLRSERAQSTNTSNIGFK